MQSQKISATPIGRAEKEFRNAFERLKKGRTERLPKGTPVSQNNVAKEAGCVPSALKKSRFPILVSEIQRWIKDTASTGEPSRRQNSVIQRNRNRTLLEKIEALKKERDHALSLLVDADARILELALENASLKKQDSVPNTHPIFGHSMKNY